MTNFIIDTKVTADGKVTVALNGKKMSLKKAIANLVEADAQIVKIRNEQGETFNYLFNEPFGLNPANLYFYWSFKTNFVDRIARGELDPKTGEPKSLTATTNTVEIDDEATETAATVETENTEVTDNKEETKMTNQTQNAVSTPATEIQAGTIFFNATAVGNGRVVVRVYGNHECAPAKLDDIVAEMPRLSDINIIASDRREFLHSKTASYNGRYYAKANVYIFTNTSYGTADAKKMYKFDTAKEAVRKLARQELDDKIITAEELEILLAADREIERQREAKREAERAELDAERAKYEHDRYYAAKIALDSKSVNDNFRYCIYCAPQQPVQTALAESRDDDNTDVFDLLPTVDELNDVDTDETDEVTEPEAAAKEMSALESEAMDTHEKLDIKIIEGAPKAEIEELAEHIAALDRRYHELHKVKYGHDAEYSPSTAAEIIADAIELLTIVDSDGNEVKPLAAKMFTDTAEVTDTEHFIQADNKPEVTETERKIAEQVCDSMTAAAPDNWSVAFTENGKFAVYSGDSVNVVDTITAGDFLNPKEFFEQFRRKPSQAELDDPNVAALAELNHEREQLLTVRDELAREYPDEVERLKLLDEMIAETDADITALKTFKKPRDAVEFDDKGNVKAVWF